VKGKPKVGVKTSRVFLEGTWTVRLPPEERGTLDVLVPFTKGEVRRRGTLVVAGIPWYSVQNNRPWKMWSACLEEEGSGGGMKTLKNNLPTGRDLKVVYRKKGGGNSIIPACGGRGRNFNPGKGAEDIRRV